MVRLLGNGWDVVVRVVVHARRVCLRRWGREPLSTGHFDAGMLGACRLSEHEMTAALSGAAKTVLAAQRRDVRKGRTDIETVWEEMDRYQRFSLLDSLGDQILPVLMALPDREVPVGAGPATATPRSRSSWRRSSASRAGSCAARSSWPPGSPWSVRR